MCKSQQMKGKLGFLITVIVVTLSLSICNSEVQVDKNTEIPSNTKVISWDFENVSVGKLPAGWKIEATHQKGQLANWEVIEDKTAPSGTHVLSLTKVNHKSPRTFNLCWTDKVKFLDGEIEVKFKANAGNIDQGGGIIWRAQDKNNYYVARFNPLEDNFRIYYVHNGKRVMMKSVSISLAKGKWCTMKIVQHGNKFEGYLNGRKLIEGKNDLFKASGGVGLWTKADAATSFDDFKVVLSGPKNN